MQHPDRQPPRFSLWILTGALLLAGPALINGFPFVFADSGDYLVFTPLLYRSPFYAPFIHAAHWSLWPFGIVALQVLIIAHLLFVMVRTHFERFDARVYLVLIVALTLGTALPFTAGQIMPDVLTPVMMLAIYLLAFQFRALHGLERVYLILLLGASSAGHLSHLPAALGLALLAGVLLLDLRLPLRQIALRLAAILLPVGAAAGAFFAYFAVIHGIPALSPAGQVFFLANLIEHGPARHQLEAACPEAGYELCAVVDRLPATANQFLWFSGLLDELGGFAGLRDEAATVVVDTLRERPLEVLGVGLRNTGDQLLTVDLSGEFGTFRGMTGLTELIGAKFGPAAQAAYTSGLQYRHALPLASLDRLMGLVLAASAAAALAIVGYAWRERCHEILALATYLGACLLGNAMLTGVLSGVFGRYQARVAWLLVLFVVLGAGLLRRHRIAEPPDRSDHPRAAPAVAG